MLLEILRASDEKSECVAPTVVQYVWPGSTRRGKILDPSRSICRYLAGRHRWRNRASHRARLRRLCVYLNFEPNSICIELFRTSDVLTDKVLAIVRSVSGNGEFMPRRRILQGIHHLGTNVGGVARNCRWRRRRLPRARCNLAWSWNRSASTHNYHQRCQP